MSLPIPLHAFKPPDWIKGGQNSREIVVDDPVKELCYSIVANGILQPMGAIDHGEYGEQLFGFRRMAAYNWGVSQKLAVPDKIPVLLYPPSLTTTQRRIITATENLQRQDLSDPEIYRLCKELMQLNPQWNRADLARHLSKDPSMATKYLSPDDLVAEALAAFLEGKFGFGKAYAIARSPDQLATLALSLNGATRDELAAESRRTRTEKQEGREPPEKVARVKIPLAVNTPELTANGTVTVVSLPGNDIDMDSVESLLSAALKAVKDAKKKNVGAKAFQAAMKDMAAAG